MELAEITSQLMPDGKPDFKSIRYYPSIKSLCENPEYGSKNIRMLLFLMVQSFCESMNVVRNMNEDQMIESAAMLLDECENFRLEDYQIMFTMAKRGQLLKIYDRIDISIISALMDAYFKIRREAENKIWESVDTEHKIPRIESGEDVIIDPKHWEQELGRLKKEAKQKKQQEWDEYMRTRRESIEKHTAAYALSQGITIEEVHRRMAEEQTLKNTNTWEQ